MKSWKNIANRIPLLVSNLHQNASLVVNDYLEGFSHNEANIHAIGISKESILLWARKGKKFWSVRTIVVEILWRLVSSAQVLPYVDILVMGASSKSFFT